MKYALSAIVILVVLSSCTFYEPEFRGGESFKFNEMKGKDVSITVGASIFNENWFALKVKPSTLDVFIEGDRIGEVHLDKKIRLKRKKATSVEAPLTVTLADGAMFKLMQMGGKDKIQIKLAGKVKGSVWFISKKVDVSEVRTIDGSLLKLSL